MPLTYAFDHTGALPANRIVGEQQILTPINNPTYHLIIPQFAPFFFNTLVVSYRNVAGEIRTLVEGIDYHSAYQYIGASRACALPVYGGISFLDTTLTGVVSITYQTIGGNWTIDSNQINTILSDILRNPRVTTWEQVTSVPTVFPVVDHEWNLADLVGMSQVVNKLDLISTTIANKVVSVTNTDTKFSIGLGDVENYATASDEETITGTLATKYTTPHGVRAAIEDKAAHLATSALLELAKTSGASVINTRTGLSLSNATLNVATLNDLKNLTPPDVVDDALIVVNVLGNTNVNDGTTVSFYWDRFSLDAADNISVVKPSTNPLQGRWISTELNSWISNTFNAGNNQTQYTLTRTPIQYSVPKIVINNVIELKHRLDFDISGKEITFYYTLLLNDVVNITTQVKPNLSTIDNIWVHENYTISSQAQIHALPADLIDVNYVKVLLNEFLLLNIGSDYTITGRDLRILYPVVAGDKIEVVSLNVEQVSPSMLLSADSGGSSTGNYVLTKEAIIAALGYTPGTGTTSGTSVKLSEKYLAYFKP